MPPGKYKRQTDLINGIVWRHLFIVLTAVEHNWTFKRK
jgi:hypothetical protein